MSIFASAANLLRHFLRRGDGDFRRRRRFAVRVVNLSSLAVVAQVKGRLWTLLLLAVGCIFGLVYLALCALVYTPARDLLPARLQSGLRADYEVLWERMDSASTALAQNDAYTRNLMAVLFDSVAATPPGAALPLPPDSLMEASEAERAFARRFEEQERYNLSVLAPVAASGMVFYNPMPAAAWTVSDGAVPKATALAGSGAGVSATYRGTVTALWKEADGNALILIHPNDFATIYRGLGDVYVAAGDRVDRGARLGAASASPIEVELWHLGTALDPAAYLGL